MRLSSLAPWGLALALTAGPLAGCGDTTTGPSSLVDPDTTVTPDTGGDSDSEAPRTAVALETLGGPSLAPAGLTLVFSCVAVSATNSEVSTDTIDGFEGFALEVTPSEGVTVDGLKVTPTLAGEIAVACKATGTTLVDPTPTEVTISAGAAAKTITSLAADTIAAGEAAAPSCRVEDAYGNVVSGGSPTFSVSGADGTVALPGTFETAGTFEVTCSVEAPGPLDEVPATLTVTPGPAVSLSLAAEPPQKSYGLGQSITVTGVGADAFGNTFPLAITDLDASPAGHHELLTGGKVRFDLEGPYEVSAVAESDASLTATLPLVVDETPPVLTLLTPERGLATTAAAVTVTGTVVDNLGEVASLTVGGTEVPVAEDGSFTFEAPLSYALNVLEVVAADPYDLTSRATRSVLASTTFHTPGGPSLEDAVVIVLSPDTIDDGVQDLAHPDDLATIVALLLSEMDFASFLPDPLVGFPCLGGACEVRMTKVSYDTPVVAMKLLSGAIRLEISLPNLAGDLQLEVPCGSFLCPSDPVVMPGTFGAETVILSTEIQVTLAEDGSPELTSENTAVEVDGLSVTIANALGSIPVVGPAVQGVIDSVVGWVEPAIVTALELAVPLVVEDQVAGALGGVLEALDIAQEVEIPAVVDGASPNTLAITTTLDAIDITTSFMRLELSAGAETLATPSEGFDPVHLATGSLGYAGCGPMGAVPAPPPDRLAAGLKDDLVNQLLLGVYGGGTLAITMDAAAAASFDLAQYGIELTSLVTVPHLPPVLDSCGHDDAGVLQVGDLWLDVELVMFGTPSHIAMWVHLEAPVDLTATTDEAGATVLGLVIGDITLGADVVTNVGVFEGDDQALIDVLGDQLLPMALESLTDGSLGFTLPAIDLSSVDESIPEGTVIQIGVHQVVRNHGYLQVEGALE